MSEIRKIIEKYVDNYRDCINEVFIVIYKKDFDKLEKELQEYVDEKLLWATSKTNEGEDND